MHKEKLRNLICSMLLGDGCLSYGKDLGLGKRGNPKPHDVFFCMNHGEGQTDYALWKANLLNQFFVEKGMKKQCTYSKTKKYDKEKDKTHYGFYVKLRWAQFMRPLRKKTYNQLAEKEHLKKVEYLLSQIKSDLHLAIWFMDDGSEKRPNKKTINGTIITYSNPKYDLLTYGYTEGQHRIIKQWFESKYGISPKILKDKRRADNKNNYLTFSVEDTKKLFEMFYQYLFQIESMKHKFRLSFAKYKPEMLETSYTDEDIVQTTTSN